jgi:glutamate/tyrosine decarboxylase-like PLP-dependent enzyme
VSAKKPKAKHDCCCEDARLIVMSGPAHYSAEEAMRLLGIEPSKHDLLVYAGAGSLNLASIKTLKVCART